MTNISRRAVMRGTMPAGAVAAAALVIGSAVLPLANTLTSNDGRLVSLWREWSALEDELTAIRIAFRWAQHHGEAKEAERIAHQEADYGPRIMAKIEAMIVLPASTHEGFLCKLDVAMTYGPEADAYLEDYPWALLLSVENSLAALAAPDVTPGWRRRFDALVAVNAEIATREAKMGRA